MTKNIELLAAICAKYIPQDEDFEKGTMECEVFERVAEHVQLRRISVAMARVPAEKHEALAKLIEEWGCEK